MARSSGRVAQRGRVNHIYLFSLIAVIIVVGIFVLRKPGSNRAAQPGPTTDSNAPAGPVDPAPALASNLPTSPGLSAVGSPIVPENTPLEPNVAAIDPEVTNRVAEAMLLINTQPTKVIEAREKLLSALQICTDAGQAKFIKTEMGKLADKWLFGPGTFAQDNLCESYMVKRGDVLGAIGGRFKVPYELLMKLNGIRRPEALAAGRAIKVAKGPFHAKVYRSTFVLDLYLQDMYVCSFPVGLGRPGHETPTGSWRVKDGGKLISPTWTDPDTGRTYKSTDPDYPLGSRYITLEGMEGAAKGRTGFAIHGTKAPEEIGMAGSRGCIRLHNGNAITVYNCLVPVYSTVTVFE